MTTIAGFVCKFTPEELNIRYYGSLALVLVLVLLMMYQGVRNFESKPLKLFLIVLILIIGFVGWNAIYILLIGGDFFGCKTPIIQLLQITPVR